jgi:hypothetical protein
MTKIVTGILAARLAKAIQAGGVLSALQHGFIPGGEVGDPLAVLNAVLEHARWARQVPNGKSDTCEATGEVHLCLYDFSNAYTMVPGWGLEVAMRRLHMPEVIIQLMVALVLEGQQIAVRTAGGMTGEFKVEGGLPQGDPCSCILWAIGMDPLLSALEELREGRLPGYEAACYEAKWKDERAGHGDGDGGAGAQEDSASEAVQSRLLRRGGGEEACKPGDTRAAKKKRVETIHSQNVVGEAFADDLNGVADTRAKLKRISEV